MARSTGPWEKAERDWLYVAATALLALGGAAILVVYQAGNAAASQWSPRWLWFGAAVGVALLLAGLWGLFGQALGLPMPPPPNEAHRREWRLGFILPASAVVICGIVLAAWPYAVSPFTKLSVTCIQGRLPEPRFVEVVDSWNVKLFNRGNLDAPFGMDSYRIEKRVPDYDVATCRITNNSLDESVLDVRPVISYKMTTDSALDSRSMGVWPLAHQTLWGEIPPKGHMDLRIVNASVYWISIAVHVNCQARFPETPDPQWKPCTFASAFGPPGFVEFPVLLMPWKEAPRSK